MVAWIIVSKKERGGTLAKIVGCTEVGQRILFSAMGNVPRKNCPLLFFLKGKRLFL